MPDGTHGAPCFSYPYTSHRAMVTDRKMMVYTTSMYILRSALLMVLLPVEEVFHVREQPQELAVGEAFD